MEYHDDEFRHSVNVWRVVLAAVRKTDIQSVCCNMNKTSPFSTMEAGQDNQSATRELADHPGAILYLLLADCTLSGGMPDPP